MYAFWEIIVSNAVIATILAIVALLLSRIWKNAAALHLIWIVVLLKLFTPPLVTTELPLAFSFLRSAASSDLHEKTLTSPSHGSAEQTVSSATINAAVASAAGNEPRTRWQRFKETASRTPWTVSSIFALIWSFGICCMAAVNATRIRRFAIAVRDCDVAPLPIRTMAAQLSGRLGLWRVPDVLMTSSSLPPLVWSIGMFPRVILPSELFARLGSEAQAAILAHELCHIRRGDYLVRFLEIAATTIFWWHPGVWCARWQLRELEEQCCDGRVLALLEHQPRTYAAALVDTLEFLSERPRTPAPFHTAVYSSGSLSRRILMLSQNRTNRLSTLSAALVAGLVTLPLVGAFAVGREQAGKTAPAGKPSAGAPPAVLRGRVTDEASAGLADVRVRVAVGYADLRVADASTRYKLLEAKSDPNGNYRLVIPGITKRTTISIDAMKPGYCRLVGTGMISTAKFVDVVPGTATESPLTLKSALYFAGIVVDEQGKPISGVKVEAIAKAAGTGYGAVESAITKSDGSFELFSYPVKPIVLRDQVPSKGVVSFFHQDYVDHHIEDAYALAPKEREGLRIILGTGHKLTGTVRDVAGKPVANAIVKAIGNDGTHRKATATDANGKFALRGISEGLTKLSATALDIRQIIHLSMDVKSDQIDLDIRLKAISWPSDLKKYNVLGMQLSDVTPELRSTYGFSSERGVLILNPGKDSDRLKLRWLAEGSVFFLVGRKRIGSVREFVDQILCESAGQAGDAFSVHVGYNFHTVVIDGGTSGELKLTKDELKEVRIVADRLAKESQ